MKKYERNTTEQLCMLKSMYPKLQISVFDSLSILIELETVTMSDEIWNNLYEVDIWRKFYEVENADKLEVVSVCTNLDLLNL